jgi:hypothetical protein
VERALKDVKIVTATKTLEVLDAINDKMNSFAGTDKGSDSPKKQKVKEDIMEIGTLANNFPSK